jgi:prepilin-type N-terminal cleavage/methylation domain-containing protein
MKILYKKAFSLIEISVVILIIGMLIAGISQGIDLYQDTRLATARSLTLNSRVARIPDLAVWLESVSEKSFDKSEAIDNLSISKWFDINPTDKSGNLASVSNANNKPKYISNGINNLPALKFDGSSDYLISSFYAIGKSKQITYFVVTKRIYQNYGVSTFGAIATGASDDSNLVAFFENDGGQLRPWPFEGQAAFIVPHLGNNKPYIASSIFTGTTNSLYLNGKIFAPFSPRAFNVSIDFDINQIIIGSRWSGGSAGTFYNGYIGEIIIFSRNLNDNEHDAVSNYLRKKWAI